MALAFLPFGAFLAGLVLGSIFTFFALTLHLLDRAIGRVDGSMLPGLVEGFRDWADGHREPRIPVSTAPLAAPEDDDDGRWVDEPELIELR